MHGLRKRIFHKVPGGILPWVLAFGLILATMATLFILQASYWRQMAIDHRWQRQVHRTAASGLAWVAAEPENYPLGSTQVVLLPNDPPDTVLVTRQPWGIWTFAQAYARRGRYQAQQAQLLGHVPNTFGKAALYITDQHRPIAIAGETTLKGTCYVPPAGVRTAYINWQGYRKAEKIFGQQKESTSELPTLNREVYQAFLNQQIRWPQASSALQDSLLRADTVRWSFGHEQPLFLNVRGTLRLRGHWEGYILINASEGIIVEANTHLDQVILQAPYITFASGFEGTAQAWARDSLRVDSLARLHYPSALVLDAPTDRAKLTLGAKAGLAGTVVAFLPPDATDLKLDAVLEPGSKVVGQVYWPDALELEAATVMGQVVCKRFWLQIGGSRWENTLFNTTIDASLRPDSYRLPALWGHQEAPLPMLILP